MELNLARVKFWVPGATAALLAAVRRWQESEVPVTFAGIEECEALCYFQRMDVVTLLGIELPEHFHRHSGTSRFVEVKEIGASVMTYTDALPDEIARCIVPNPEHVDARMLATYIMGEIINNCRQHSRGPGFVSAQVYPQKGEVRIGVADAGIGLRESFRRTRSPHYRPE